MERSSKTFIIISKDRLNSYREVFLTWISENGGYYAAVKNLDMLSEQDLFDSVGQAMEKVERAHLSKHGGWCWAPMKIVELLNFNEAYNSKADPEYKEIVSITYR